jgi:3'-phosphoadenosine 5'-phosphosulfate sulfotransferase (PAPS reductase)/FAD synthetase
MKTILSVSGGKDSTAMYLLAMERNLEFQAVFADTGNEHDITYEYVTNLSRITGGPDVRRVKADFTALIARKRKFVAADQRSNGKAWSAEAKKRALNLLQPTGIPFLDLCIWKGRFPSTAKRFCSQHLKSLTIYSEVYEPLLDQGRQVLSWQGIRADESRKRSLYPVLEMDSTGGIFLWNYRPILRWTTEDVFAMHKRHGIKPNPLYKMGMGRVGCMPCIHARKDEIREIATRFPEHIEKIARWEKLVSNVSKQGQSTFFSVNKTPGPHQTDHSLPMPMIKKVVEWSRTTRGGRQYGLFHIPSTENHCASQYGLCE